MKGLNGMNEEINNLSADAEALLSQMQDGLVLWFSDAGEYPDRFWLESAGGETTETGALASIKAVTELKTLGHIEPDSGDSYRQRWRLVNLSQ